LDNYAHWNLVWKYFKMSLQYFEEKKSFYQNVELYWFWFGTPKASRVPTEILYHTFVTNLCLIIGLGLWQALVISASYKLLFDCRPKTQNVAIKKSNFLFMEKEEKEACHFVLSRSHTKDASIFNMGLYPGLSVDNCPHLLGCTFLK